MTDVLGRQLLTALIETREVAAACFRVMARRNLVDAVLSELPEGLTERAEGFGVRADDAIKAAAREGYVQPSR
jgi:hypothetical protein